jgi:diguanylate cyclase (GGDEF)-like protein
VALKPETGVRRSFKSAISTARRRIDWRFDRTRSGSEAQRSTVARTLAIMFGFGAILLLLTVLLPPAGGAERNELALVAIGIVALAVSAGLLISFGRTPMRFLTVAPTLGSVLVGAVICFAGPEAATSYALYFAWVVVAASTFLSRTATALHGAVAVVIYDAATRISGPGATPSALALVMLAGTALVAAVVLAGLATQLRTFVSELESDARTDPLTGLNNRRALREMFAQELGRSDRTGRPLALILLDIDHFKLYNDALGHPAGDDALRRLSKLLDELTRSIEIAARTGGEEFAIVAPETGAGGAVALAERLRLAVETEFATAQPPLTVSLGIAVRNPGGLGSHDLFEAADQALYRAKGRGRNRVEIAPPLTRRFQLTGEPDEVVEGRGVGERVA